MKLIKGVLLFALIFLISISLTSGLELTASTGSNDGSSSTHVVYGATVDDYANEQIGLSPEGGTLSNVFKGTGSLPSGSISKSDANGNYVQVSRSVDGVAGKTSWIYDWKTSVINYGVRADLIGFTVKNAKSINAGSYASTKEGDAATLVFGATSPILGQASVENYNTFAIANNVYAEVDQNCYKASAGGDQGGIGFHTQSSNAEGDFSNTGTYPAIGEISGFAQYSDAFKSTVTSEGKFDKVVSNYLNTWSWASNKEGDGSGTQALVDRNRLFQNYATTATSGRTLVSSNMKAAYIGTLPGGYIKLWDQSQNLAGDWTQAYTIIEPTLSSSRASASAWGFDESSQASQNYCGANIKSLSASSDSGNLFQELYGKNAFNDHSWSRIDYTKGGTIKSIPYKPTISAGAEAHSGNSRYTSAHLSDSHAGGFPNWANAEAYNAYRNQYRTYNYPNYKYNCWSVDAYTTGTQTWSATVTPLG